MGIVLLAALGAAAGQKGYLKLLGPAPLRFRSHPPVTMRLELPPLVPRPLPGAAPAILNTNQAAGPEGTGQSNDPALFPGVFPDLPPDESAGSSLPAMQTQPPGGAVISPEAVMGYLVRSGTNTAGKLPNPAFVPPLPPTASPSSQATYESH